jgi:hypothetical protein
MKDKIYIFVPLFFVCTLALISATTNYFDNSNLLSKQIDYLMPENSYDLRYLPRKDTLFITNKTFISISLKEQLARLHRINDTAIPFHISSGNENIEKGIKTTTGIYTVQSKLRLGISKQFNNAELINWIGFNGNIGFHGLKASGYYNYLGKRPSSHGCVRISRESGDTLYKYVKVGTPVIVYDEEPARIISFYNDSAKSGIYTEIDDNPKLNKFLKKRLDNLYSGWANRDFYSKLLIRNKTVFRKLKIPTGEAVKIAPKQKYIGAIKHFLPSKKDNTYTQKLVLTKLHSKGETQD